MTGKPIKAKVSNSAVVVSGGAMRTFWYGRYMGGVEVT